jgi:hypothetical protein
MANKAANYGGITGEHLRQYIERIERLEEDKHTVLEDIKETYAEAKAQGILLGAGYGKWKSSTFRVANFPGYTEAQIEQLSQFIRLLG